MHEKKDELIYTYETVEDIDTNSKRSGWYNVSVRWYPHAYNEAAWETLKSGLSKEKADKMVKELTAEENERRKQLAETQKSKDEAQVKEKD